MMRLLAIILCVLGSFSIGGRAIAQSGRSASLAGPDVTLAPDQQRLILEEALSLYDEGMALRAESQGEAAPKFEASAERFELLINAGIENGHLYYNLANAQFQAGALGKAVANYRRALRFMPGDPRIESNLEFARSQVEGRIPASGSRAVVGAIVDAIGVVPTPARLGGALALYVLVWVLVTMRLYRRRWVPRSLVWWCAAFALLLGASVVVPSLVQHVDQQGVIVDDEVIVRMGNGEGYDAQFAEPIHEGVEFSVLERRGEWLEIELPNGGRGWIRADQAEII